MTLALLLTVVVGVSGQWQTFTNTDFVNGLCGTDSVLYLATNGGLQPFRISDTAYLTPLTNADGLTSNTLKCCVLDQAGRVWIGTDGGGLVRYDPPTGRFASVGKDNLPLVINCLAVSGDTVVVGTDNGVWLIADDKLTYVDGLASLAVKSVGAHRDFWIGGNQGVNRVTHDLQVTHFPTRPRLLGDTVKSIAVKDDTLFIATEWGVARYSDSAQDFVLVAAYTPSPPATYVVYQLAAWNHQLCVALGTGATAGVRRYNGAEFEVLWSADCRALLGLEQLWIGFGGVVPTMGNGLGMMHADGTRATFRAPGLASNAVPCAVLDSNHELYACHYLTVAEYRGISRLRSDGTWQTLRDTLAHACVAACDRKGRIWFGHWKVYGGGLSYHDPSDTSWHAIQWGPGDYRNVIAALAIDPSDTKWVFNQVGELVAFTGDDSTFEPVYFRVPGVAAPPGGGYDFAFDARGRVWFGNTSGLAMLDYAGTLHDPTDDTTALYSEGLLTSNVQSVAIDRQDRPWVATSQGAGVLERGRFRLYTTNDSRIPSNYVARVRVDSWGNIWFLTDRGLAMLDPLTEKWTRPDSNRLIPNLGGRSAFYSWLELAEDQQTLLVASQGGLSRFTLALPTETTLARVRLYPNPFRPNREPEVNFEGLPALGPEKVEEIRIFTLAGELVIDNHLDPVGQHLRISRALGRAAWDGRNWQGKPVTSGLYLVAFAGGRRRHIERIAIVR